MASACSVRVRGVVQGVGFRPFVYRLAQSNALAGWVLNGEDGVEIHLEGAESSLRAFLHDLESQPPRAASITAIEVTPADPVGFEKFTIRESRRRDRPTVRISPDLPVCADCLRELSEPSDRRYQYPYINCTHCGPRYSVVLGLPYDRSRTTMEHWPLDAYCAAEYHDPENRRYHAQPVACPECGPHYFFQADAFQAEALNADGGRLYGDAASITRTARLLEAGRIVAVKGLGGYHLACDARNPEAVATLRERKYRKEKAFALMAESLAVARSLVELSPEAEDLLNSPARPIVLAPARVDLPGVAPDHDELGVMLPYAPLHHLLFAAGAPNALVMTSANRSSEPIAYEDQDALDRLAGIADAFLIGERPIARRVDDSVARVGAFGPMVLRRSRGFAPGAVAQLPVTFPVLAVGADLKNTVTLVVGGQAFTSQHIGDLDHYSAFQAFQETIHDLVSMYEVAWDNLVVVHDSHPQYVSTLHALSLPASQRIAAQHHRAHIASVLAERGVWEKPVLGVSFDGTGYGDDGAIWGGEFFVGSVIAGFQRVAHLRTAVLPGGDAAAQCPVQAAAGFLSANPESANPEPRIPNPASPKHAGFELPDFSAAPFHFPPRYEQSLQLVEKGVRTFPTTSMGRLFDTAAALLGFTREITFEGQAAMWLERLARAAQSETRAAIRAYPFPLIGSELDFRPLLCAVIADRLSGRNPAEIARAFQFGIAEGLATAIVTLCRVHGRDGRDLDTIVLSGGVFQNELLLEDLKSLLDNQPVRVWTNRAVPPNDGGISLGQAALAAFSPGEPPRRAMSDE